MSEQNISNAVDRFLARMRRTEENLAKPVEPGMRWCVVNEYGHILLEAQRFPTFNSCLAAYTATIPAEYLKPGEKWDGKVLGCSIGRLTDERHVECVFGWRSPKDLRTDGPTLAEFLAAGGLEQDYPPQGFAVNPNPAL